MRLKLIGIATGLALLATAVPAQAAGLTSAQVSAVISLLQSFNVPADTISRVQSVLNGKGSDDRPGMGIGMMGSSTAGMMPPGQVGKMFCIALNRDLGVGSQGDDVRNLQQFLMSDPSAGFTGTTTGFFGPMTAKAMMRFQMMNGIASSTSGNVGPATRGFLQRRCGKGLDGEHGKPMMGTSTASTTTNN